MVFVYRISFNQAIATAMASSCLMSVLVLVLGVTCGLASETFFHHGGRLIGQFGKPDCQPANEDECRNITELITSKGYPCEEYSVTTEDGFILGVQRIPHGRLYSDSAILPRPLVFLQHGLLDSSATWVINSASQSLGFILADAGFDVWLGNMRGNTYSRRHLRLKPDEHEFWNFSWDEMARYDLPAMLKFVMATTNQSAISYIGHSQGTLIAFARFSHDQELAQHIHTFVALGPIFTVSYAQGAVPFLVDIVPEVEFLFRLFGVDEFLPSDEVIHFLATKLCSKPILRYICENILFLIVGSDGQQFNMTRLPVYISHTPAGTSVQNMVHFAQMVKSKKCQMYDFGSKDKNMLHYNQSSPPVYNVSALTIPTYVYSAERDLLADPQDVKEMLMQLHSLKYHRQIAKWQHLDFIWAKDANKILYQEIVQVLRKHAFRKHL